MHQHHHTAAGAEGEYWIEPDTGNAYPTAYDAYRLKRETEDRRPARHRRLAPDVDHLVWRRTATVPEVEVVLTVRPGTPPRIRRIVAAVLGRIRGGRSATDAIRSVAHRFGLRYGRARAFISGGITFERRPRQAAPDARPCLADRR